MDVAYAQVLAAAAPIFIILATGYIFRKKGWLSSEADASLLKVVVNLLYPCIILDFVLGNPAIHNLSNLAWAPVVGFTSICVGFLAGWLFAPLIGLKVGSGQRTFSLTSGIYNYGYIPIPLILILFDGRETIGVLFVHNLGIEVAFWTVGIVLVSSTALGKAWVKIFNPPVIALILGIVLTFSGMDAYIPSFLRKVIAMFSSCAIPVGVLVSGAILADHLATGSLETVNDRPKRVGVNSSGWVKIASGACFLRILVLPLVFLVVARYIPVSAELKRVMVVQAAMPAGIFPIVVARHFGGDASVAVKVVLSTSLIAVLTIPFWISFGLGFVGIG